MKDNFIEIYKKNIKREGADKLIEWLGSSDFFTAPASTQYHGNYEGGLCEHSVHVFNRLAKFVVENEIESVAICALLHDVCKVNYYTTEMRNIKENGVWIQKPYYTVKDQLPYGHGEKSVYIISSFMKLTREEAIAINWHMGGFDYRSQSSALTLAYEQYPLALNLHIADMQATYLDDKRLK